MSHLHTTNWVSSLALQQSQTRTHVHVCGHTHAQTQRTIWASECQNYSCCADSPTGYHLSYIRSQLLGLWVTFQCHSGDPEINTKKLTILLQIKSLGNYYAAESPSKFMENVLVYTQGHYYQLMAVAMLMSSSALLVSRAFSHTIWTSSGPSPRAVNIMKR